MILVKMAGMLVGVLKLRLHIEGNRSLKGKRRVIKQIKESILNKFGATVAEVGEQDKWQTAVLGVGLIGNDERRINASLDRILNHVENMHLAELADHEMEFIHM